MFGFLRRIVSMPDVRLAGARVTLRPPRDSDFHEWANLRRASRDFLVPWEPTWPRDALMRGNWRSRLRHYAEEWHLGSSYSFLIFRNGDNTLLGGLTMSNVRRGVAQAATIGYWVGAAYAYQGVMTEAVNLILRFAFDDLGLHRVEAACLPSNSASRGLLRKCGFVEEGYAAQYLKINGEWRDHVLFGRLPYAAEMAKTAQAWPASPESIAPSTPSLASARAHLVPRS